MKLLLIHVFLLLCVVKPIKLSVNDREYMPGISREENMSSKFGAVSFPIFKFCFLKLPLVEDRFYSHRRYRTRILPVTIKPFYFGERYFWWICFQYSSSLV